MDNKRKILLAGIIALLLIGSLVLLFLPKTQLNSIVAPSPVNIQIDNGSTKRVNNGDKLDISPGTHTIKVSEDDFTSYSKTITIKSGETQDFLVALKPNSPTAQARLNNPTSQAIVQRFNGPIIDNGTAQLNKDYPILKILPIQARLYSIHPCASVKYPNDATKIAICVDGTTSEVKPYAIQDIASRGYNVDNYEMIYSFQDDTTQQNLD